ncbi:hypothetical protein A2627_00145 [Candidatus Woesebacteria bacterium RIFCSPHIGHO2_01_FULL_39_28]|uniref:General secretion pathway GspH domain-containing protein n=1 Tax=Candidatus Woesebacteria bacterium RIFCSPHIGHO2_01_FULL_39_28 TaxID=1802496 RepID=A0A1F7YCX6_9BACT|nr:MAG: hypothetical protein A2627_00145 [Candidatus Woesebacteria bacterium RIFCSPHIGHO2_01_FULL_39_28]OGM57881.1 MAG: hypothetical protein A3A50_04575 [Candidatus Woesebacteria bacterium RIFCSPLOWO2_01_FULL_38_20]
MTKSAVSHQWSTIGSGYTLIEVLVVISIMITIFVAGFANFRQYSRSQSLTAVIRVLRSDLRFAQEYALSGRKPAAGCSNLDGYYFRVDSVTRSYSISPVCSSPVVELAAIKQVTFLSDISDVSVTGINPILFKVIGEGTNIPAGTQVNITLTQTGGGSTQTVTVTPGGEIR